MARSFTFGQLVKVNEEIFLKMFFSSYLPIANLGIENLYAYTQDISNNNIARSYKLGQMIDENDLVDLHLIFLKIISFCKFGH